MLFVMTLLMRFARLPVTLVGLATLSMLFMVLLSMSLGTSLVVLLAVLSVSFAAATCSTSSCCSCCSYFCSSLFYNCLYSFQVHRSWSLT